jgi:uncharacterized protein (TIRG00374 family)
MTSLVIKVGVTLMLVVLIATTVDLGAVAGRFLLLSPVTVAALISITMAQMFALAYRWCLLSRMTALALPFLEAIRCILASQFFSQSLPASVGGDALRVWWLKRIGFPLAAATQNVLLDRLAGFLSLLVLNLPAVALLVWMVGRPEAATWLGVTLAFCAIAFVAAASRPARRIGLLLLLAVRKHPRVAGFLKWGLGLQRTAGQLLLSRQGILVVLVGILIHLVTVLLCFLVARDLALPLSFATLCSVVPGVLLISYLPISIGGWGIREGGMAVGLGLTGVAPVDAVFIGLVLGALGMVAAALGALVWLVTPMPVSLSGKPR